MKMMEEENNVQPLDIFRSGELFEQNIPSFYMQVLTMMCLYEVATPEFCSLSVSSTNFLFVTVSYISLLRLTHCLV